MEVEVKKVKITKSIINQSLMASTHQMFNCDVLGFVVLPQDKSTKTRVLIYDGTTQQVLLGPHYKSATTVTEWDQIDNYGTRAEVLKVDIEDHSGHTHRWVCPTNEETEDYYHKVKSYMRRVNSAGQVYY
jgi:hypothetical protein